MERNDRSFTLEQRTERVAFISKERGTERVPEIRGTTKALLKHVQNRMLKNFIISARHKKVEPVLFFSFNATPVKLFEKRSLMH